MTEPEPIRSPLWALGLPLPLVMMWGIIYAIIHVVLNVDNTSFEGITAIFFMAITTIIVFLLAVGLIVVLGCTAVFNTRQDKWGFMVVLHTLNIPILVTAAVNASLMNYIRRHDHDNYGVYERYRFGMGITTTIISILLLIFTVSSVEEPRRPAQNTGDTNNFLKSYPPYSTLAKIGNVVAVFPFFGACVGCIGGLAYIDAHYILSENLWSTLIFAFGVLISAAVIMTFCCFLCRVLFDVFARTVMTGCGAVGGFVLVVGMEIYLLILWIYIGVHHHGRQDDYTTILYSSILLAVVLVKIQIRIVLEYCEDREDEYSCLPDMDKIHRLERESRASQKPPVSEGAIIFNETHSDEYGLGMV